VLLLEERVTALVDRHRAAHKTIEELRARVVEQNQAIAAEREQNATLREQTAALRGKVDEYEATRTDLRQRVDRLLEVVVQLEREAGDDSATVQAEGAQEPEQP